MKTNNIKINTYICLYTPITPIHRKTFIETQLHSHSLSLFYKHIHTDEHIHIDIHIVTWTHMQIHIYVHKIIFK